MILNMNQLKAFFNAANLRSITKAAQALMVTPAAITIQVKQFEETIGIKLMFREGNGMQLTDAGEALYRKADEIFGKIHEVEDFL